MHSSSSPTSIITKPIPISQPSRLISSYDPPPSPPRRRESGSSSPRSSEKHLMDSKTHTAGDKSGNHIGSLSSVDSPEDEPSFISWFPFRKKPILPSHHDGFNDSNPLQNKASRQFPGQPYHSTLSSLSSFKNLSDSVHSGLTLNSGSTRKFFNSGPFWLIVYFFFNLGLTLFNKIVLVSFPFPYTLTGIHALSCCAGCYIALGRGAFVPAKVLPSDNLILIIFSVLYTINISVSNLSLQLVTVPFHQVVRAATPLFTIIISAIFLKATYSRYKILSLLPVIIGVGLATYGDYHFTVWGLMLTLLGTVLAAIKTVVTNLIQTGVGGRLRLHPLDLLMRMSPLAFAQCIVYGWLSGELDRVRVYGATELTKSQALALMANGVIAFGLNVVSFTANKKTSALTMTVAANVKQVLTIVLAVIIFDLSINHINGIGIFLTLSGGSVYAYIEYKEKTTTKRKLRF